MDTAALERGLAQLEARGYAHVGTPEQGRQLEALYGAGLFPVPIHPRAEGEVHEIYLAVDPDRAAELMADAREPGDPATWGRFEAVPAAPRP